MKNKKKKKKQTKKMRMKKKMMKINKMMMIQKIKVKISKKRANNLNPKNLKTQPKQKQKLN